MEFMCHTYGNNVHALFIEMCLIFALGEKGKSPQETDYINITGDFLFAWNRKLAT